MIASLIVIKGRGENVLRVGVSNDCKGQTTPRLQLTKLGASLHKDSCIDRDPLAVPRRIHVRELLSWAQTERKGSRLDARQADGSVPRELHSVAA